VLVCRLKDVKDTAVPTAVITHLHATLGVIQPDTVIVLSRELSS